MQYCLLIIHFVNSKSLESRHHIENETNKPTTSFRKNHDTFLTEVKAISFNNPSSTSRASNCIFNVQEEIKNKFAGNKLELSFMVRYSLLLTELLLIDIVE